MIPDAPPIEETLDPTDWQPMPEAAKATFRTRVPRSPASPESVHRVFTDRVLPDLLVAETLRMGRELWSD